MDVQIMTYNMQIKRALSNVLHYNSPGIVKIRNRVYPHSFVTHDSLI